MLHIPPMTQLAQPGRARDMIVGEIDRTIRRGIWYEVAP